MIRLNLLYPVKPVFKQTSTETEKSFYTLWLCTITENIFRKKKYTDRKNSHEYCTLYLPVGIIFWSVNGRTF